MSKTTKKKTKKTTKPSARTSAPTTQRDADAPAPPLPDATVVLVDIDSLQPSAWHPRGTPPARELTLRRESLRRHGVLRPLTLSADETGSYRIITGYLTWLAARAEGHTPIPAVERPLTGLEARGLYSHEQTTATVPAWNEGQFAGALRRALEASEDGAVTQERLAAELGWSIGKTNERLTIHDRLTDEVLAIAGVEADALRGASAALLLRAAKADTKRQRAAVLARALLRVVPSWASIVEREERGARRTYTLTRSESRDIELLAPAPSQLPVPSLRRLEKELADLLHEVQRELEAKQVARRAHFGTEM